jgi:hypothetical protein
VEDLEPRKTGRKGDAVVAGLAGLLAALAAAVFFQERYHADGPLLIANAAKGGWSLSPYLPVYFACSIVFRAGERWLGIEENPERALQAVTLLGAFLLAGGTFLAARAAGECRRRAILATVFVASTPSVLMFTTTVEKYALHAGVAALAYACATWGAPGRGGLRGLVLGCVSLALVGTDPGGSLLVPGLLAYSVAVSLERGFPPTRRWLGLLALPWVAAGLVFLVIYSEGFTRPIDLGRFFAWHRSTLAEHWSSWPGIGSVLPYLREALAFPAPLALVAGLLGLARLLATSPRLFVASVLVVAPSAAVFPIWGFTYDGNYFLALVPFFCLLGVPALAAATRHPSGGRLARIALVLSPFACATAWRLSGFDLLWILAAILAAWIGWTTGRRERREPQEVPAPSPRGVAVVVLLLALVQASVGIRAIVERNRANPEAEWARAASRALPRGTLVLTSGWQEPHLLWWVGGMEVEDLDLAAHVEASAAPRVIEAILASGRPVAIDERAIEAYREDEKVAAVLRSLRERFDWNPAAWGTFRAIRLVPREPPVPRPQAPR